MKKIVKIALVAIIACFAIKGVAVLALSNGDRTEMMMQKIQEKLELTDEQVSKIKPILENFKEQMHSIKSDDNIEDKRAAVKDLMDAQKEELSKILSEDQMRQLHDILMHKRGRHGHHRFGHDAHKNDAMHSALKAYFKENIMPVIKYQRAELDEDISRRDRKRIDEIRAELEELHPKGKDGWRGHRGGDRDCDKDREDKDCDKDREDKDCDRDRGNYDGHRGDSWQGGGRHGENHDAIKALMHEVKDLMVKYESEIKSSLEPLGTQKEAWMKDVSRIIEEHISEEEAERVEHIRERVTGKMLKWVMGKKYLLLDPTAKDDVKDVDVAARKLNVFPNPAKGFNTFEFEVLEDGNVTIGVFDQQGKLVKTVLDEYRKAGNHKIEVSLEGLEEDLYFYQVVDKSGDASQRFMVK